MFTDATFATKNQLFVVPYQHVIVYTLSCSDQYSLLVIFFFFFLLKENILKYQTANANTNGES